MVRLFTIFTIFFIATSLATAQESYELTASQITIAGTSNVHDWKSDVTKVEANGNISLEASILKNIKNLTVTIPVGSIKSTKGALMDKKTWSALKKETHSTITYTLTKVNNLVKSGDSYDIKTSGNLTIAGETRLLEMTVKGKVNGNELQFEGAKKLKMSDFNIAPPTALMGTMKTGDEITVSFNIKLAKNNTVN